MFVKNRNKKVGLCVMVVTSCFILAGIWAVLATPETALAIKPENPGGGKDEGVAYKMVIDTGIGEEEPFVPESAPLLTEIGDGSLGGSGPLTFFTNQSVLPTGSTYPIGDDTLGIVLQFKERKGVLSGLTIGANGDGGVWHVSDVVPFDPFTLVAGTDMVIVVNADNVDVHRKNKSGPVIGTIAIGTIRLTVVQ